MLCGTNTKDIIEVLSIHLEGSKDQWEKVSKTACFNGARACGGSLGVFHAQEYPLSFHWVEVQDVLGVAAALISASGPFVALSETIPKYYDLEYTSNSEFANAV